MPKSYFNVRGKMIALPGKGRELLALLLEVARIMETLPNCHCFILGTQEDEPDAIHIFEVWTSQAAHQASTEMPEFADLVNKMKPLIAGTEDAPSLVIHGGKAKPLSY